MKTTDETTPDDTQLATGHAKLDAIERAKISPDALYIARKIVTHMWIIALIPVAAMLLWALAHSEPLYWFSGNP